MLVSKWIYDTSGSDRPVMGTSRKKTEKAFCSAKMIPFTSVKKRPEAGPVEFPLQKNSCDDKQQNEQH